MNNSLKQHKILKILLQHFNNESYTIDNMDDEVKALSSEQIHRKTGYKLDTVTLVLSSLQDEGYVNNTKIHGKGDMIFWYIENKGKNAVLNNTFVWIYRTDNILKTLSFLIALFGALNSIFHWFTA